VMEPVLPLGSVCSCAKIVRLEWFPLFVKYSAESLIRMPLPPGG
jgi:hypothetical protein